MKPTGYGTWMLNCQNRACRHEFEAKRQTAKYCSPACRKAAERQQKSVQHDLDQALAAIDRLIANIKAYPSLADEVNAALRQIKDRATDGLKMRPDSEQLALMNMLYDRQNKRDKV